MNSEKEPRSGDNEVNRKTLVVLGLTFILPVVITLIVITYIVSNDIR